CRRPTPPSWTCCAARGSDSAQLAVLAAAPVVAAVGLLLLALFGLLAADAQAHARHRLATGLGDRRVAFLAALPAGPLRQLAAGALDRVLHRCLDLFVPRAVACPARCHRVLRQIPADAAVLPHPAFRSRPASRSPARPRRGAVQAPRPPPARPRARPPSRPR